MNKHRLSFLHCIFTLCMLALLLSTAAFAAETAEFPDEAAEFPAESAALTEEAVPFSAADFVPEDGVAAETTAGPSLTSLSSAGSSSDGTAIVPTRQSNGCWLILPASADPAAVPVSFSWSDGSDTAIVFGSLSSVTITSGSTVNLTELCGGLPDSGYYIVTVAHSSYMLSNQTLKIRFSDNIAAMFMTSDDPENQGRAWVESSPDRTNKATGSMVLVNPDGSVVYSGGLTQIKGRGNSTWGASKKPYQIKLSSKTDLLETGDKNNKNKTWVLLANYYDTTMMHNTLTYDLAAALNMTVAIQQRYVELYYDGEYRGTYLLCEKVAVDPGRVEITDLDDANEEANPDVADFAALERGTGTTANGATYVYTKGLTNPENITGGYLLEMDFEDRAKEEASYFITSHKNYVVVKSPEYCTEEEISYIASLYQDYEDAVYYGGVNPHTGKAISDYVDMDSIAQCYLINELSKNIDAFRSSSFLYKDVDSDIMYMGPVWDYDLCYGLLNPSLYKDEERSTDGWLIGNKGFANVLYQNLDFRIAVYRIYQEQMYPLVKNTMLGGTDAVTGSLHSLAWYNALTTAPAACNYTIWSPIGYHFCGYTYQDNVDYLSRWLTERSSWMSSNIAGRVFNDVTAGAWYATQVAEAAVKGLMRGEGGNRFAPEANLTRAEMAQVLYAQAGKLAAETAAPFTDVSSGAWYYTAISWCTENHLIYGYPDNTYRPNASISREDAIVLLYRYAGAPAVSGDALSRFSDRGSVSGYAVDAMEWAAENHILSGYEDGTIRPGNNITRAELATLLVKLF